MRNSKRTMMLTMAAATLAMSLTTAAAAIETAPARALSETEATRTTGDVVWFADQATPVGTSNLLRRSGGVVGDFSTSGLAPREALTLWWVVFNNPAGCSTPCGENDIFVNGDPTQGVNLDGVAAADIVVGYATGTVADDGGYASMSARLREGDAVSEVLFGAEPLLKDSLGAEVHLVARSHGPAIRGLIATQTGSYAGGCEAFLHPPSVPTSAGECADIQFAVHLP